MSKFKFPEKLPEPDDKGNYWLGEVAHSPAILTSPKIKPGKFYVSTADDDPRVFLFDKDDFRYFDSPEEALAALKEGNGG